VPHRKLFGDWTRGINQIRGQQQAPEVFGGRKAEAKEKGVELGTMLR
jgi:hypothetical protein